VTGYEPAREIAICRSFATQTTGHDWATNGVLASGWTTVSAYLQALFEAGASRQTSITYSGNAAGYAAAPNVTFTYDPAGNRTSMSDGTGITSYRYDGLERLTSVTNGGGSEVDYAYNNDNAISGITYPGSNTVTYHYDTAGEADSVTDWLSHTTNFTYGDHDGNLTKEDLPNGDTSTVGFNYDDQITSISDAPTASPQSPFATFTYTRDADSQVGSDTDTGVPAPTSQTYGYDALKRAMIYLTHQWVSSRVTIWLRVPRTPALCWKPSPTSPTST
jgi:YD repeat-containing protein